MVIFHFLYDMNEVFGIDTTWYENTNVHIWQQSICWSFIIISGFVWQLGVNSHLRRGVVLNICGCAISLITVIFIPSQTIWFGILNFMGCASLIMIPLHKVIDKISPLPGMALSMFAFAIFRNITKGSIGVNNIFIIKLPDWLYESKVLTPIGFPYPGFISNDYFPILPWLALFMLGYYFYSYAIKTNKFGSYAYRKIPVLSQIGQRSIAIYLLHQPICMLLCAIIVKWIDLESPLF